MSNDCIKEILNNDLSAMVAYVTPISELGITTLPKEIRGFLDIGQRKNIIIRNTFLPAVCLKPSKFVRA